MDSPAECAPLQGRFVDQTPWRAEGMRPRVLWAERPATPRARAPTTPPHTVRGLPRRGRPPGLLGLLPGAGAGGRRGRTGTGPAEGREAGDRLQALYRGWPDRDLARLVFCRGAAPHQDKPAPLLGPQRPGATPPPWEWGPSHT